jgi:hypothetical protein
LILRIEGRTPNDEPAEFQIKFAGSFVAAVPNDKEPPVPKVTGVTPNDNGVRVNSVGTIVAVIPKPKPTPKPERTVAEKEPETKAVKSVDETQTASEPKPEVRDEKADVVSDPPEKATETAKSAEVTETKTETKPSAKPATAAVNRRNRTRIPPAPKPSETKAVKAAEEPVLRDDDASATVTKRPPKVVVTDSTAKPEPNPLANVRLVILFKDGSKVERPMTEVERFTVDQHTLTVVGTNGRIARFSMLEVASVNIQ